MDWKKTKATLLKVAEDEGACEEGVAWLKRQTDPECLISQEATHKGYMSWAMEQLDSHPEFEALLTPTPAQYERCLMDEDWNVRYAWAERTDLTPTAEQYERGLVDEDWHVRHAWAERDDIKPSTEQYERGLVDKHNYVRLAWGFFALTPEQYERGLADGDDDVRQAWHERGI